MDPATPGEPRPARADTTAVPGRARSRRHWDTIYQDHGPGGVSWFQPEPRMSLELIHALDIDPHTPVIDAGGGSSLLADRLSAHGFTDLTVLDLSEAALTAARQRLTGTDDVTWQHTDLLTWRPHRRYGLWHDRAVFHFLTNPADRHTYLTTLRTALRPGGHLILATFAPDGPDHCSGLPVSRYSPEDLADTLGDGFTIGHTHQEKHTTPTGAVQAFTWVTARRR